MRKILVFVLALCGLSFDVYARGDDEQPFAHGREGQTYGTAVNDIEMGGGGAVSPEIAGLDDEGGDGQQREAGAPDHAVIAAENVYQGLEEGLRVGQGLRCDCNSDVACGCCLLVGGAIFAGYVFFAVILPKLGGA